jgi:HEAT repeat protein
MQRRSAKTGESGGIAYALCAIPKLELPDSRVSEIIDALGDDDWQVRTAAATELEAIGAGAATAVPTLVRMWEDSTRRWGERRAAADALKAITGRDLDRR